ncbi:MAG: WbqC family protein [Deltaproteobacteria bacterium]|nr:WbqC family protein [Deltaproteobacteria bacterium]
MVLSTRNGTDQRRIVVGHQPQYLPHLGLFNKIAKGGAFVFVDNVQYQKKSWQNRTLIKGLDGKEISLTIPVQTKGRFSQRIRDVEIVDLHALRKHLKTIRLNYQKTVGYDEVMPRITKWYEQNVKYLVDVTIPLMRECFELLGIQNEIFIGTELGLEKSKTELLIEICQKTNFNTYLSGQGAKDYLQPKLFEDQNLTHLYNEYEPPTYRQTGRNFLKGMFALDLLFNEGTERAREIFWANVCTITEKQVVPERSCVVGV